MFLHLFLRSRNAFFGLLLASWMFCALHTTALVEAAEPQGRNSKSATQKKIVNNLHELVTKEKGLFDQLAKWVVVDDLTKWLQKSDSSILNEKKDVLKTLETLVFSIHDVDQLCQQGETEGCGESTWLVAHPVYKGPDGQTYTYLHVAGAIYYQYYQGLIRYEKDLKSLALYQESLLQTKNITKFCNDYRARIARLENLYKSLNDDDKGYKDNKLEDLCSVQEKLVQASENLISIKGLLQGIDKLKKECKDEWPVFFRETFRKPLSALVFYEKPKFRTKSKAEEVDIEAVRVLSDIELKEAEGGINKEVKEKATEYIFHLWLQQHKKLKKKEENGLIVTDQRRVIFTKIQTYGYFGTTSFQKNDSILYETLGDEVEKMKNIEYLRTNLPNTIPANLEARNDFGYLKNIKFLGQDALSFVAHLDIKVWQKQHAPKFPQLENDNWESYFKRSLVWLKKFIPEGLDLDGNLDFENAYWASIPLIDENKIKGYEKLINGLPMIGTLPQAELLNSMKAYLDPSSIRFLPNNKRLNDTRVSIPHRVRDTKPFPFYVVVWVVLGSTLLVNGLLFFSYKVANQKKREKKKNPQDEKESIFLKKKRKLSKKIRIIT